MRKFYFVILLFLILSACGTRINYLGSSYAPTHDIDVFVNKPDVKKPYEIIGKGFINTPVGTVMFMPFLAIGQGSSMEFIQRKAIEKARIKGADAILFEHYDFVDNSTSVITSMDSMGRTSAITASTHPTIKQGLNILFLKYKR